MRISDWSSDVCSSDLEGMQASDAATLAGVKALADAGIDPNKVGLLVSTSVSRDYLEPSTASIVSGNLHLPDTCQNFDVANARPEERRVGQGCVGTCRSRWSACL